MQQGGEECPPSLVALHHERLPHTRLHNEYGPTEAAVWSHGHSFTAGGSAHDVVPIGRPIPGARQRVLDESGTPADTGELWIGGLGVALGYLGDDVETDVGKIVA